MSWGVTLAVISVVVVPFVSHNPVLLAKRASPPNTVRSDGFNPAVPASSVVPPAVPFVSHNPPVAPAKRTSLPNTVRSAGAPAAAVTSWAVVPFVVHNPDPPLNSTWPLKTVRLLGLSPEVPAISWVPAAVPFVTHNP